MVCEHVQAGFSYIFEGVPSWSVLQGPSPHSLKLPHHLHSQAYIAVAALLQVGRKPPHYQLCYLSLPSACYSRAVMRITQKDAVKENETLNINAGFTLDKKCRYVTYTYSAVVYNTPFVA